MSNQEPQNQNKTTEEAGVEKRRRFIKGAGVATPVILTLASPSVFGIQCGSEIASGNQSQQGEGSCTPGRSPDYWKDPEHRFDWPQPYVYGTRAPGQGTACDAYKGGGDPTKFKDVFGGHDNTTLQHYLCVGSGPNPTLEACLIAALLNAAKSRNYPLTVAQVKEIQAGTLGVPPNPDIIPAASADVIAYLQSTW